MDKSISKRRTGPRNLPIVKNNSSPSQFVHKFKKILHKKKKICTKKKKSLHKKNKNKKKWKKKYLRFVFPFFKIEFIFFQFFFILCRFVRILCKFFPIACSYGGNLFLVAKTGKIGIKTTSTNFNTDLHSRASETSVCTRRTLGLHSIWNKSETCAHLPFSDQEIWFCTYNKCRRIFWIGRTEQGSERMRVIDLFSFSPPTPLSRLKADSANSYWSDVDASDCASVCLSYQAYDRVSKSEHHGTFSHLWTRESRNLNIDGFARLSRKKSKAGQNL